MDKNNDLLAYVYVAEQTSPEDNVVRSMDVRKCAGTSVVRFDTCLHSFGVMNRNQRQYVGDNIMECIEKSEEIQTYLHGKRWFGEQDHPNTVYQNSPLTPERVRKIYMPNRSHVILSPRREGERLNSIVESACNDVGQGFRDEVIRGMIPAFSCRAIAHMVQQDNKPTIIARKVITYDWVLFQSHREAEQIGAASLRSTELPYMESVVTKENTDTCVPLTSILKTVANKDPNIGCIMESFGLEEQDLIGFDKKTNRAVIKDNHSLIFSRLSKESIGSMHDFLASF